MQSDGCGADLSFLGSAGLAWDLVFCQVGRNVSLVVHVSKNTSSAVGFPLISEASRHRGCTFWAHRFWYSYGWGSPVRNRRLSEIFTSILVLGLMHRSLGRIVEVVGFALSVFSLMCFRVVRRRLYLLYKRGASQTKRFTFI